MLFFILCYITSGMYVLNLKGIQIPKGQFQMIKLSSLASKQKNQINHTGEINVTKVLRDSSLFDIFVLDNSGFQCYLERYYNASWEQPCFFLSNVSQTFLLLSNFTLSYNTDENDEGQYLIIDNTYFPSNGAYYNDALHLQTQYTQFVQPIPKYYNYTIKIIIVFIGFLVCFLIWCIVLTLKYKKETKHKEKQATTKSKENGEQKNQKTNKNNYKPYKRL